MSETKLANNGSLAANPNGHGAGINGVNGANIANSTTLTPAQKQQQLLALRHQQQLKLRKIRGYEFAYTSEEILKKYAKYPPSMTFHIYETHYRFNNSPDSNIIPKDSPMIKDFLHHVLREEIPIEMSELIKDFAIKPYDGCIILQVYDHRNMVEAAATNGTAGKPTATNGSSTNTAASGTTTATTNTKEGQSASNNVTTTAGSGSSVSDSASSAPPAKPKTYRTILKPTSLSLYYDLLYHTDSALTKFTDPLSLQMESEILTLTNRKLDLSVPLNPYTQDELLHPETEYPKKVWDEKSQDYKMVHSHREAMEKPPRKLHQEEMVLHRSSEYEEIMFLLSNKYKRADDSEKKLVVVGGSTSLMGAGGATSGATSGASAAGGTAGISSGAPGTPATPGRSKEGTIDTEIKAKKTDILASSSISGGPASNLSATGQFMRLRFIEDIRKRKEAQKLQKDATVAMQAQGSGINTIDQNNNIGQSPEKLMNGKHRSSSSTPQMPQQSLPTASTAVPQIQQQQQLSQQQRMQQASQARQQQAAQIQQQQQQIPNGRMVSQKPSPVPNQSPSPAGNAVPGVARQNMTPQMQQAQVQQQLRLQQQRQLAQQQLTNQQRQAQAQKQAQLQQQAKRQKLQQMQGSNQPLSGSGSSGQFNQNFQSPQMANSPMASSPMANNMQVPVPNQRMQQLQQQMPVNQQNRVGNNTQNNVGQMPSSSGAPSGGLSAQARQILQHQQQQLFQTMLSPQDQATFKSLQSRVNILINMGQTGVAPNKNRLNPQQQQAALQQAKQIQQNLVQKFPAYFQRLRQLQIARQRAQAQAQNQAQGQQPNQNQNPNQNQMQQMQMGSSMQPPSSHQQNQPMMSHSPQFSPSMMMAPSPMNQSSPPMQSPMNQFMDYEDDKKRKYKRYFL